MRREAVVCSSLVTVSTAVLVLAHFFTPLPLVAEIATEKGTREVFFAYAPGGCFAINDADG